MSHSASPTFQSAGLRAVGIEGQYLAVDVDAHGLREAAEALRRHELDGANVTLPHKALALTLADRATAIATQAGAANTWFRGPDDLLWATNTDVAGVLMAIDALVADQPRQVVILGAGGAAAGTAQALVNRAERVTFVNRTVRTARDLAQRLTTSRARTIFGALRWPDRASDPDVADAFARADLIVQATSLPYMAHKDRARAYARLPWEALSPTSALLDLAYTPGPTEAVARARAQGVAAADGATMLLYQGAVSFYHWTHVLPPIRAMRDALAKRLGRATDALPVVDRIDPRWLVV